MAMYTKEQKKRKLINLENELTKLNLDFDKKPQGFEWATRYKGYYVGLFPSKYKNYDVNKLPTEDGKIKNYYWAEGSHLTSFDGNHGGAVSLQNSRSKIKKHLICLAYFDKVWDSAPKNIPVPRSDDIPITGSDLASFTLSKCREHHRISTRR